MIKINPRCPHCNAKMVEYKHGFNKALAVGLFRIIQIGKPINIRELGLTRNQWDNFQKLRYWNLVEQVEIGGSRKKGVWKVTPKGLDFYKGIIKISKGVWTYRGETIREEGESISYDDKLPQEYKQREEYAIEARMRVVIN